MFDKPGLHRFCSLFTKLLVISIRSLSIRVAFDHDRVFAGLLNHRTERGQSLLGIACQSRLVELEQRIGSNGHALLTLVLRGRDCLDSLLRLPRSLGLLDLARLLPCPGRLLNRAWFLPLTFLLLSQR